MLHVTLGPRLLRGCRSIYEKEGEAMVELDQFKSILATYTEPLVEVRDSL